MKVLPLGSSGLLEDPSAQSGNGGSVSVSLVDGIAAVVPWGDGAISVQTIGSRGSGPPVGIGMPVILPVGEDVSASAHLTDTTVRILCKELRRGSKMTQHIDIGKSQWSEVYAAGRFFQRFAHYLEFDFVASSESILQSWLSWGRSQLQELPGFFESMGTNIVTLRPWPNWLEFRDANWPHARAVFVGLQLEKVLEGRDGVRRCFDIREPIFKFLESISTWPLGHQLYPNMFDLSIRHVRLAELEHWLSERQRGAAIEHPIDIPMPHFSSGEQDNMIHPGFQGICADGLNLIQGATTSL